MQGTDEVVGKAVIIPTLKMKEEVNSDPPKLSWHKIYNKFDVSAEILAAFELVEWTTKLLPENKTDQMIVKISPNIKPNLVSYRLEVYFWGVRNLKKASILTRVTKPKIVLECVNFSLSSDTLIHAKHNLNFPNPHKMFEVVSIKIYFYKEM